MHYGFQGHEHPLPNRPHQNSKSNTPYKRTKPSTLKRMRDVVKELNPKDVVELIDTEAGGIEESDSFSALPRDNEQVRNVRRNLFSDRRDEFAAILERCKLNLDEHFIRSILAAPDPACVLATDVQLDQLEINCTGDNFSVMTIDPTFNLGDFYVTPMVFKLKQFVRKQSNCNPICLGPILVHQRQQCGSYSYFANQLTTLRPKLKGIKAVGTDGESALFTAMLDGFPSAVHLRCFRHFRENIVSKLKELHITEAAQQEILLDVFGEVSEEQHQLGLVDSEDEEDYMAKVASLQDRWDSLELTSRRTLAAESTEPQFHAWFMRYKSEDMCTTKIRNVREKAGLLNEERFYTNTSESINEVLKAKVEFKKCKLNQFVDHMLQLVKRQEKDMRRAVCRVGDWRLHPQYSHLEKSQDEWLAMSSDCKKAYLRKVLTAPLKHKTPEPKRTEK